MRDGVKPLCITVPEFTLHGTESCFVLCVM